MKSLSKFRIWCLLTGFICRADEADELDAAEICMKQLPTELFCQTAWLQKDFPKWNGIQELKLDLLKTRKRRNHFCSTKQDNRRGFVNCLGDTSCKRYLQEGCPELTSTRLEKREHWSLWIDSLAANHFCNTHLPFVGSIGYRMETVFSKPGIQKTKI